MGGAENQKQPVIPLAVTTVAVVVLALLAGSIGVAIIRWLVQLIMSIVALIGMALLGRYLWFRGRRQQLDRNQDGETVR